MSNKKDCSQILSEIKSVLGKGYSFDNFHYRGMNYYCTITCDTHGDYKVKPACIIHQKQKCSECRKQQVREENLKVMLGKLNSMYEGTVLFDEGQEYVSLRKDYRFLCTIHNSKFVAKMSQALKSKPCPLCKSRVEGSNFIEKARMLHNDRYQYYEEDYVCSRTKTKIYCRNHSEHFYQRPSAHLRGQGCPKCANLAISASGLKSQEDFINYLKRVCPDGISYSQVEYKGAFVKVNMYCSKHGEFSITPANITSCKVTPCKECRKEIRTEKVERLFIENSRKIHNNFYDYSLVNYRNNRKEVKIVCPSHGIFLQQPNNHLEGKGCPQCSKERLGRWSQSCMEDNKPFYESQKCYLYLIKFREFKDVYKVGISVNPKSRFSAIEKESGYSIDVLKLVKSNTWDCVGFETEIKKLLKGFRFSIGNHFGGYTEIYKLSSECLEDIIAILTEGS